MLVQTFHRREADGLVRRTPRSRHAWATTSPTRQRVPAQASVRAMRWRRVQATPTFRRLSARQSSGRASLADDVSGLANAAPPAAVDPSHKPTRIRDRTRECWTARRTALRDRLTDGCRHRGNLNTSKTSSVRDAYGRGDLHSAPVRRCLWVDRLSFEVSHRQSRCYDPRELCSWLTDCLPP
jgi:hypothetical protein